jgi:hypothetical protein
MEVHGEAVEGNVYRDKTRIGIAIPMVAQKSCLGEQQGLSNRDLEAGDKPF